MSSDLPSRDNGYAAPVGSDGKGMRLNKAAWDAALVDAHNRLVALEDQRADLQALIDAGTEQALLVIQANVAPQLMAVGDALDALNVQIALAEDRIAAISSGGIGAAQVVEDANRVFVTPAQKAAIGTNAAAIADRIVAPAAAVDGNLMLFDGTDGKKAKDSGKSLATLGNLLRDARTSNTALAVADNGKLIDITSGTFTQTFVAAATLKDGWFCYLRNSGTGDITLDPNASELIDGLTSYIMYPGECRLVMCTGAAFVSVVVNAFYKVFTASGTFVKPPGYAMFEGRPIGGGGAGAKGTTQAGGGGGGAGPPFSIPSPRVGVTIPVTIAAGGVGASTANTVGAMGGDTSFGSLAFGYGGGAEVTPPRTVAVAVAVVGARSPLAKRAIPAAAAAGRLAGPVPTAIAPQAAGAVAATAGQEEVTPLTAAAAPLAGTQAWASPAIPFTAAEAVGQLIVSAHSRRRGYQCSLATAARRATPRPAQMVLPQVAAAAQLAPAPKLATAHAANSASGGSSNGNSCHQF